ncbi:NADH-quinone oxidoreductase subunit NuoK [bacterium]|nr:NADH-quinone oxidoreductase subunit NuoK [candidate division CSSED10-310 bacterium]
MPLSHMLVLSMIIFLIGIVGFLIRRNLLIVLMCLELMLNAVNINMVAFSQKLGCLGGQAFSIFIITVAAAEAAVGLAIIVALYRNRPAVNKDDFHDLRR